MPSRRPRGRPKKAVVSAEPNPDTSETVTELESQEEIVVEPSSESEVTEPVQSVTTSDEPITDSDELLDITPTVGSVQSFEYIRRDRILVCPACGKQAACDVNRKPICSSTQHPDCPRSPSNG